jgi:hypothetical protein
MTAIAYVIKALPNLHAFETIEEEMNMSDVQRERNKTPELKVGDKLLNAQPLKPILSEEAKS